jgi:transcriptional regulator with AAA-type ATPase domain
LLYAGDFGGARDVLKALMDDSAKSADSVALLIQTHMLVARKTLKWDELDLVSELIGGHRSDLSGSLLEFTQLLLQGSRLLCRGELHEAESSFRNARLCLGRLVPGEVGSLYIGALRSELSTRYLRRLLDRHAASGRQPDVSTIVSRLLSYHRMNGAFAYEATSVAAVLDYVTVYLESLSRVTDQDRTHSPITMALFLRRAIGPALRSVSDDIGRALARTAPTFFRVLRSQLRETVGQPTPVVPSTQAIDSVLGAIDTLWNDVDKGKGARRTASDALGTYEIRFAPSQSRLRQAKRHMRDWQEDAAVYASLLRAMTGDHRPSSQSIDSFGYLFGDDSRPTRALVEVGVYRGRAGSYRLRLPAVRTQVSARADTPPRSTGRLQATSRSGPSGVESEGVCFEGSSQAAEQVRQMIEVAADCDYPVLVIGDTGVGKEVVARCIHARSARSSQEMVIADCGTTTDSLLESELFGHKKGAFTGAEADHVGFVEKSHRSTLFLDEVDSMSARMQASLLRVLETGEYRPVGENAHRRSDFRLIAAAMPRLIHLVDEQHFRRDLFYRISALRIHVPALAERENDAAEIAQSYAAKLGLSVSPAALDEVDSYTWPGNIRQLRHCIEVASLSAFHDNIDATAVRHAIDAYRGSSDRAPATKTGSDVAGDALIRASRALAAMPHFGAWEFARAAGISRRSAQRHLARLLRLGQLVRLGAGRATRYRIRARPRQL